MNPALFGSPRFMSHLISISGWATLSWSHPFPSYAHLRVEKEFYSYSPLSCSSEGPYLC